MMGWNGVYMMIAFIISNTFSSGYNSTTSLVPSGMMLAILLVQQTRHASSAVPKGRG